MAFRLKLNEPMSRGIKRIGAEQIDCAVTHLEASVGADPVRAVHETRKCLKRARALLRFAWPVLERPTYKALSAALREIGRGLSATRDLDVLDQTVATLQADQSLKPATVERLRRVLDAARADLAAGATSAGDQGDLARRLALVRTALDEATVQDSGRDLVTGGLARCLDACRGDFERAFDSQHGEAFHDWRKTIQLHWRHMQLVERAWPEYCRARIAEARAISLLIGNDRDLAMLQAFAAGQSLPKAVLRDIDQAAARLSPGYRSEARARGERLLAEGTQGMCRRIEHYWAAAQSLRRTAADAAKVTEAV